MVHITMHYLSVLVMSAVTIQRAATLLWFTAGGAIRIAVGQLSQTWKLRHYDVITPKLRDREKRRPPRAMKCSELANGENGIALRQLLQNRK